MYSPSSSSRDDSASEGLPLFGRLGLLALVNLGFRLFHLRGESCSLMEARFIVGGLARCFLLASGGTRALALKPLVAGHVRFVLLDRLIHLMGCQGTSPCNFRIQHVPHLLSDSVQGDLILEGFQLCLPRVGPASPCQGCSRRCLP